MDLKQYEAFRFQNRNVINIADRMPEHSFPAHWHFYGEIILVGKGDKNLYMINETRYTAVEGDILLVWPMEIHEIIDADRHSSAIVQFSNTFADSLYDFGRIMHYYHDIHIIRAADHPELSSALTSVIKDMRRIWEAKDANREIKCTKMLLDLMLLLDASRDELAGDADSVTTGTLPENTIRKITEVTDYIRSNLTGDDITQARAAEMAGISKDYFSRIFKQVTGQNYNKWLNMIRIEKALSLLPDKTLTVTDIAMLSGFKSIPSFNRIFKEEKNMSPSRYRAYSENS